jgi:hypothetical protein
MRIPAPVIWPRPWPGFAIGVEGVGDLVRNVLSRRYDRIEDRIEPARQAHHKMRQTLALTHLAGGGFFCSHSSRAFRLACKLRMRVRS